MVIMVVTVFNCFNNSLQIGPNCEGSITRNICTIGAYRMVVPHLIDDSDGDDEDGLPSNHLGMLRNYFWMSKAQFQKLLDRVTSYITHKDTAMRVSISAKQWLMVSSTIDSSSHFMSVAWLWGCVLMYVILVDYSEISRNRDTHDCLALWVRSIVCSHLSNISNMKDDFLTTPTSFDKWVRISNALERAWIFPNAIGKTFYSDEAL